MDALLTKLQNTLQYYSLAQHFDTVQGYLHSLEGYMLMLYASDGPGEGAIVEIGSFMGKSTCWLARGAKDAQREKVTAVDHFTGSPEHQVGADLEVPQLACEGTTFDIFMDNLNRFELGDYVTPIKASSEEAAREWDQPIRLLFIDADHSYEGVKNDYELWAPHVVPGGIIAFHDTVDWPGVARFFNELIASGGHTQLPTIMSLGVLMKE